MLQVISSRIDAGNQVAEYKIGIRIGHGTRPIVGIIIRSVDYFYIDHRAAAGLADIAERFGKNSAEWYDLLRDLNHLIENGADLKLLGDCYMESPWQTLADAKTVQTVSEYFKLSTIDLRVSLESSDCGASYVITGNNFNARGDIRRENVIATIHYAERMKAQFSDSDTAIAAGDLCDDTTASPSPGAPSLAMIDAIRLTLLEVQASADLSDLKPLDCLAAALSSLLGYENWASSPESNAATVLS